MADRPRALTPAAALAAWITGPWIQPWWRDFLVLWVAGKGANVFIATYLQLPPLAFRPTAEIGAFVVESYLLLVFAAIAREDVLAANLGVPPVFRVAPFALAHGLLSGAVALLA